MIAKKFPSTVFLFQNCVKKEQGVEDVEKMREEVYSDLIKPVKIC